MAEQAGRDPDAITISFKAPLGLDGTATATVPRTLLSGSAGEIAADLRAYAEAGVRHFVFDFTVATVPEMQRVLERFAAEVRPRVARGGAL
jgi:alkanesulfonate monooxygenase SsuD/methylene tetrahydromethanopterin reductase-like flavin-dependent oxidoreductase (luciferase family)